MNDWNELTEEQKKGIEDAIDEIDAGSGIPHSNGKHPKEIHQCLSRSFGHHLPKTILISF